jgi:hypothetical protein
MVAALREFRVHGQNKHSENETAIVRTRIFGAINARQQTMRKLPGPGKFSGSARNEVRRSKSLFRPLMNTHER